ncbi:hypothetical protein DPMN_048175 [Dreissena polymorpha]|uniref:Uncharacterized protein n=1 Tax=Dreissena polymorpha TaxID=45954 RepID=A0A9D4DAA1_DREPO|nr:hypothetical protein DPMN_048175 [Dreissena polymorpha]
MTLTVSTGNDAVSGCFAPEYREDDDGKTGQREDIKPFSITQFRSKPLICTTTPATNTGQNRSSVRPHLPRIHRVDTNSYEWVLCTTKCSERSVWQNLHETNNHSQEN